MFLSGAPGAMQDIRNDTSSRGWLLAVDPDLVSTLLTPFLDATGSSELLPESGIQMIPLNRSIADAAEEQLRLIKRELEDGAPGWRESSVLLLGRMLIELSRDACGAASAKRAAHVEIGDLPAYVAEHYSQEFTLDDLARLCGTAPGSLSKAFKETAGKPLFSYINDIRVEKACGLLKRTDMTVLEISFIVGYNNVSFFNRYFRRLMGTSPTEYRKMSRS
jgi:AraC-like DNA-binding protein